MPDTHTDPDTLAAFKTYCANREHVCQALQLAAELMTDAEQARLLHYLRQLIDRVSTAPTPRRSKSPAREIAAILGCLSWAPPIPADEANALSLAFETAVTTRAAVRTLAGLLPKEEVTPDA